MIDEFQKFMSLLINMRIEGMSDLEFCIQNYLHRNLTRTELIQFINFFGAGKDLAEDHFDMLFEDTNYFVSSDNSNILNTSLPVYRQRRLPESSYFSYLDNENIQVTWMEEYGFMQISEDCFVSKTIQPLYLDSNEKTQDVTENIFVIAIPSNVAQNFHEHYQVTPSLDGGFVFSGEFKISDLSEEIQAMFSNCTILLPVLG